MKLVTWNCNGGFGKKFPALDGFDADICVVQECENPFSSRHKAYRDWAKHYLWIGDNPKKGLT